MATFITGSASAQSPGVIVSAAARISFPLTVEGIGTARANESVEIRSQVTETVTEIHFREGQHVSAGAVLVELRSAEAKAAVAAAKAAFAESERRFERTQKLFEDGLISDAEIEPVRTQHDRDRAQLAAAEARLAETIIRAPFAGRLGLRRISVGSLVSPSTVITTLDDTHVMKLDFDVPETAISLARPGLAIVATSAAWPDTTFSGKVLSVDTRVDPVSRTITLRAQLPNPGDLLRPGMFLSVKVLQQNVNALVVPEQALVPERSRLFVYVVGDDGMIEKREVQIGRRRPGMVEVTKGLAEGEVVVIEGTQKAKPGQPVQIIDRVEVAS